MTLHWIAYPLVALVAFVCGSLTWLAWHRGEVTKVQDELRRLRPLMAKAMEAQSDFETAHRQTTKLQDDLLHRKWGGPGVARKSGIIT